MEKPRRSQSRAWPVSPTALALAVGLAGWGTAALAGEPIDGVDDKLGKNAGGSVVSTPRNNNGTIQFTGLERTARNPGGGAESLPGIATPISGIPVGLEGDPDGSVVSTPTNKDGTYLFTGLAPGKYNLSVAGQRVQTITVGANRSIGGSLTRNDDGTASLTIGDRKPVVLRGLVTSTVSDSDRDGKKRTAEPAQDGGDAPGKKHNYKGVVTLVRGTAPRPGEGKPDNQAGGKESRTRDPDNQAAGKEFAERTRDPDNQAGGKEFGIKQPGISSGGSGQPVSKEAALGGPNTSTRGRLEKPDQALQPGISDQGSSGGLSSYDRAPPPDAASSGKGEARTFKVTVQSANDPPSKVATGIPPPVDPGGAPVAVQLRNVDTGALARTMPNPANGELAFTGLPAANYVVEIVDAAGKVVGTSPSQRVAAGGTLSGRLDPAGGGAGAFFGSTAGVRIGQNAAADKPVRTAAASDVAASPVGGFGKGMPGSPGFGPDVGRMNGPGPGMMSPSGPGPGAPAMSGPMGMGGRAGPMMGGAMGRP